MPPTVFISYPANEQTVAEDLHLALERRGIVVLRDRDVMRGGGDWRDRLLPLIGKCDRLILLWTESAARSQFVTREVIEALENDVTILPLRLDDYPRNPLLTNVQEFDGRANGMSAIFDALGPAASATGYEGAELNAIVATYRRILADELTKFPVLLTTRAASSDQVIRLNVTDELADTEGLPGTPARDITSLSQDNYDVTLLIGHPGAGKSTSARFVTWHLLSKSDGASSLPFIAHCRFFEPKKYPSIRDFVYAQAGMLVGFGVADALRKFDVAARPNTVLVFDGFDELPSGRFDAFLDLLEGYRESPEFVGTRIILTSRVDAYRQYELRFRGWRKLLIAPLSRGQIDTFVHAWFGEPVAANELLAQIDEPRLAELAVRPFLLAMMCLVKEEGGDLGRNRSELYHTAIGYLERRQAIPLDASTRILRRNVLDELAMRLLQFGTSEIDRTVAGGIAAAAVRRATGHAISLDDAVAFLDAMTRDVGITQLTLGEYSFVHRTFMEYLAASRLNTYDNSLEIADEYANVARWEEPIRLYAGMQKTAAQQAAILKRLWTRNPALALRTLTDAKFVDHSVIASLIADTDVADRVRMLQALRWSLRDVDTRTRLRLIVETAEPLLYGDADSEVIYNAILLLQWVDPSDALRVIWRAFGTKSALKRQQLLESPEMYFSLVPVTSGTFMMGDNTAIDAIEQPAHQVTVDGFSITSHQITNKAYEHVTGRERNERHPVSRRDRQPCVALNWFDAFLFALRIGCRLPTEAEWEYAARGGSDLDYCFGNDTKLLPHYANFEEEGNPKREPWDVGSGLPNAFGLYDMHGNVWEWCADWLDAYPASAVVNPAGPSTGLARVRRGGGFAYHARGCRSAFRWGNDPSYRFKDIGARVVIDDKAVAKEW